jgi:hypothetical protein
MGRFGRVIALATVGILGWAQAQAIPIVQNVSLSTSSAPAGAPAFGSPASYALFDPALGALDYVDVRILGTWQGSGTFGPCLCLATPQGPIATPYTVSAQFEQEIRGLGAGTDIGFPTAPTILFNAAAPSAVGGAVFYDLAFRFDATTDLLGFATVSGGSTSPNTLFATIDPPFVQGARADFIGTGPAFFLNLWESTFQVTADGTPPATFTYSYEGTMLLTYEYTPFDPDDPAVPVDEPSTLALLGITLLVPFLGRRGRLRRRA